MSPLPKISHDAAAEQVILGNCFLQSSRDPLGDLAEHEFFSEHNRKIYHAIVEIAAHNLPINFAEAGRWLTEHGNGVPIPYLTALIDGVPEHAERYLSIYRQRIRETAAERLTRAEAYELGEAAKRGEPVVDIIDRAGRLVEKAKPTVGLKPKPEVLEAPGIFF